MYLNLATIFGTAQPSGAATSPGNAPSEGIATQGVPTGGSPPAMGPCGGNSSISMIVMLVAMVAIFYFLLIRPQQKKAKDHQSMLSSLKKGDDVVTGGGLVGKISGISDKIITLEVSEKVRVRVLKSQVVDKFSG